MTSQALQNAPGRFPACQTSGTRLRRVLAKPHRFAGPCGRRSNPHSAAIRPAPCGAAADSQQSARRCHAVLRSLIALRRAIHEFRAAIVSGPAASESPLKPLTTLH